MAAAMEDVCGWCGTARWDYRCSMCDPRWEKKLCVYCSKLWHSRGFARGHELTSRSGITRSFLAWGSPGLHSNGSNSSVETETKPAVVTSSGSTSGVQAARAPAGVAALATEDTQPSAFVGKVEAKSKEVAEPVVDEQKEAKPTDPEKPVAEAMEGDGSEDKEQEEKEDESMEEEFEFEMVGESVDSGEDADAASVENVSELEEKAEPVPRSTSSSAEASTTTTESSAAMEEPQAPASEMEKTAEKAASAAVTVTPTTLNPVAAASSSMPAHIPSPSPSATSSAAVPAPTPPSSTPASVSPNQTPTCAAVTTASTSQVSVKGTLSSASSEVSQPKPVDLEKLLRWFPTNDHVLVEMLAARIEAALVIEDALICARIGKCEEPTCRSVLLHYEHCKREEMCGDPKCAEIYIVYKHRRACLKKDAAPTGDGKKLVCPFCIRIRQRRSLGVVSALDHLISDQRRALRGAHSEANRNFCLQSINTWSRRKQELRTETDRLNQLASECSAPIFNFPRYQWHFSDTVLIKREPTPVDTTEDTTRESAASIADSSSIQVREQPPSTRQDGDSAVADDELIGKQWQETPGDSMPGRENFNATFINVLLRAKAEGGDRKEVIQREFDGVMELGYAIVDASFCAPAKAQRCLLNCKSILVHLQHHLDLQVCTQAMCTAVEHHFAHLSQCKARGDSESCEYCLRVEERQFARSVDFMEAEVPEAEAKVQKIINDITASFTNQHPDEREQEVIQLEDELEQAEDNKRELSEKLSAARLNLRSVRRNLEHRGLSTSASQRLPLHFVNVRRGDGSGSGSSSKKRRLQSSYD